MLTGAAVVTVAATVVLVRTDSLAARLLASRARPRCCCAPACSRRTPSACRSSSAAWPAWSCWSWGRRRWPRRPRPGCSS
ncbi:hypothetical protein ACFQX7_11355 [Luedemannella flava]